MFELRQNKAWVPVNLKKFYDNDVAKAIFIYFRSIQNIWWFIKTSSPEYQLWSVLPQIFSLQRAYLLKTVYTNMLLIVFFYFFLQISSTV